jgi:hypothetical protein
MTLVRARVQTVSKGLFVGLSAHGARIQEKLPLTKVIELLDASGWRIRPALGVIEGPREPKGTSQESPEKKTEY